MRANLDAPNLMTEIPIGSAYQYVQEVDTSLIKDMEEYTEVFKCLEDIIAFEISRYVLFHVGGERSFDQCIPDHLGRIAADRRLQFEKLSGKKYIYKNSGW